jgi:hypothetical protein
MGHDTLTVNTQAEGVTSAEREHAARYLGVTRDRLAEAMRGLSEAQWNFKPAPDRWSIAEVMEHVAIVEDRVQEIVSKLGEAPADAPDRDVKQMDVSILVDIPRRYPRFKAPERVSPVGGRTGAQALQDFLESRARTVEILASAPHLRGRVVPHPVFGPWDGYEWVLGGAAHCARHTGQIMEVKADPNFPAA